MNDELVVQLREELAAKDVRIAALRQALKEAKPWVWGPIRRDRIQDLLDEDEERNSGESDG